MEMGGERYFRWTTLSDAIKAT
ncbi:MAG: hypothetical protein ACQZ3M_06085 [cyanobacterium endosymbiont of Rhopalodia fuxianensis]